MPMASANVSLERDIELADEVAKFYADPFGFVLFAYPWGEPGALENYAGPDVWQAEVLKQIGEEVRKRNFDGKTPVAPIRLAVASGHGIGKSTLVAWLVDWILSTRPHAKGTVTANTFTQLSTKTWAAIQTWTKRCVTAHWFEVTSDRLYHRTDPEWFCSAQTCKEENSESFAGQHAASSTSFFIFDEASAVPDVVFEVAEGGLTDGEPMIFLFGNATRSQGTFHRATFGSERHRWLTHSIDSRNCAFSNKELIAEWITDKGEDSDFVRVRVKGIPPRADDSQFIDMERITAAQKREVVCLPDEPLLAGADLAWGGDDDNVVRFRCGRDACSIKPVRIPGEKTRDPAVLVVKLADVLTQVYDGRKVHTLFVDSAGIAGSVVARLRRLGHKNVIEVNFGADSPDEHYANMRAYMWGQMKDWLLTGAIDADTQLESDLMGPGYSHNNKIQVKLERKEDMKKRGLDSPDDADALSLTFAINVPTPLAPLVERAMAHATSADPSMRMLQIQAAIGKEKQKEVGPVKRRPWMARRWARN